jgi:predicted nucleotidyltransferase
MDMENKRIIDTARVIFEQRPCVLRVDLFGSRARGDDHPGSDVDLLVRYVSGTDLYDIADLHDDLETSLGEAVNLVEMDNVDTPGDEVAMVFVCCISPDRKMIYEKRT